MDTFKFLCRLFALTHSISDLPHIYYLLFLYVAVATDVLKDVWSRRLILGDYSCCIGLGIVVVFSWDRIYVALVFL